MVGGGRLIGSVVAVVVARCGDVPLSDRASLLHLASGQEILYGC